MASRKATSCRFSICNRAQYWTIISLAPCSVLLLRYSAYSAVNIIRLYAKLSIDAHEEPPMIKEIKAKSILTYNKHPEQWFGVNHNVNLYRGCQHGCIYCDSRSSCYHIEDFDGEVLVKINGPDLLEEALAKKKHHVTIGSGAMSDCYMPIEKSYELMKRSLEIIDRYKMRLHVATKSTLILRDIDLIERIASRYANIAVTITTADDALAKVVEPHASSSSERFEVVRALRERNIIAGVLLMPQLPYLMEDRRHVDDMVQGLVTSNASFVVASFGMTLRDGNREYYYKKLKEYRPELVGKYEHRYGNQYGIGCVNGRQLNAYFKKMCTENNISTKMPMYREPVSGDQLSLF